MFNPGLEQHANSLADYMPNGRLFEAKRISSSNFRQLLLGLAGELFNAQGYIITLEREYLPDMTNLFLSEWEQALGIPDDCFTGTGSNDDRRRDIVVKLASLGVQTAQDFEDLALLFGAVVTVTPLSDEAFPPYAVPFTPVSLTEGRFTIVVTGTDILPDVPPYDVPFDLFNSETILECLFNKQKPANCNVVFRNLV
jgi:uncharacterized protein YmfQ (DUF2313 family)